MSAGERKATALLTTEAARYLRIERRLRSGGATFVELRSMLLVSDATLKRDLHTMRNELGAPIAYERDADVYRFSEAWGGVRECLLEGLR